ncbi:MAG: endonuclease/exonuclease/phosphatase family protein [Proteobacteria bacterium]|nr:endonuclease/exonuclease/phosphatase family protein [Pseudomonadota bacterium]
MPNSRLMIRVASYNMRKAIGTDRRRSPERVIEVLNEIGADIVALQEADRRFGARVSALPAYLLEEHSPYRPVPLPHRTGGIGWHGNAILVHREIEIAACEALHIPALEPRGAVMAELHVKGTALRIIGMHLDLSGLWRRRQSRAILHRVELGESMATVMMGDLNEWTVQGGCLRDFGHHFTLAPTGRSFHARRPVAALDRIMFSGLKLADCGVHSSAIARKASDHLPIWADFASTG